MSDTNPKHTPTPWQWDGYDLWHFGRDYNHPDDPHSYTGIVADKRLHGSKTLDANMQLIVEAVNSHAALKARCAELEKALHKDAWSHDGRTGMVFCRHCWTTQGDPHKPTCILSPRDGEAK